MPAQVIAGDIREHDPSEFKAALQEAGIKRIDTAARYGNGESEKIIGRARLPESFTIDTKILWKIPVDGTLTAEAIERSLSHSLEVLGVEKVNVLYAHGPDNKFYTPIAESARAFNEQYKKGRFNYLGLSNFMAEDVEEWLSIAAREDLVKPTVYEGQYNLLCRTYETTLFPLLRENGIHFNAYSPLAGGFLLGNFTAQGVQGGSRFSMQSPFLKMYDKPSMHEAIKTLQSISRRSGLGMDELSLRWLVHHSVLGDEDAVILGASKVQHFGKNMDQITKGPLDEKIVQELNNLWKAVESDAMVNVDYRWTFGIK